MVHAFGGEHSKADAHDLCIALRKLNYKAYVHRHRMTELEQPPEGIGFQVKKDVYNSPYEVKEDHNARLVKKSFNYAQQQETIFHTVFVGDFSSLEDPALKKTLDKIHALNIDLEKPDPDSKDAVERLNWFRNGLNNYLEQQTGRQKKRGPLGRAFAARNPMLPKIYQEEGVVDDFVAQMNDTKYSLLNNPGKYTVKVGTFVGYDEWNVQKIQDRIRNNDMEDAAKRLMKAAENAEKLCNALREKGHEAYVFHDRTESVVTVGAFDRIGDPRDDGKIEIHPGIHRIIKEFEAKPVKGAAGTGAVSPRVFAGIPCDAHPIPVKVPRRSGDARKRTAAAR
jgi:hypothetical protein